MPTISTGFFPLDVKVKDIEAEVISLPVANIEVCDS